MGKALYRKHRPKNLSEVVGQEPVTTTLANALKSGHISHAYLLTGPRGTGKTSIARILAHEVNGLPYEDDATHLDIIEIDAASNRRIDEIRELRDRIHIAPTSATYKVYIIDEVHMLTREAFNALLKTLEEPPEHAIFILATTEAHKLPDTIISRTQRFSLKPIHIDAVVQHLREIAEAEGITIDDEALRLVAAHGQGSFRDSISLLDQVKTSQTDITAETIESALGRAPQQLVADLVAAVSAGDAQHVAQLLSQSREHAVQATELSTQLSQALREQLLQNPQDTSSSNLALLRTLMGVPHAHNPQLALELALFEPMAQSSTVTRTAEPPRPVATTPKTSPQQPAPQPSAKKVPAAAASPNKTQSPEPPAKPKPEQPETASVDISDATDAPTPGDWQDILGKLKGAHNTLYGIVRMANPVMSPGSITLEFNFPFHQKRVSDARYLQILMETAAEVLGYGVTIQVTLNRSTAAQAAPVEDSPAAPPAELDKITEIFGTDVSVDAA